jgi:hypothetical protein
MSAKQFDLEEARRLAEELGYWPASTDEAHIAKLRAQNVHYDELMAQDPEGTKWQKMSGAWTRSPELFNLERTP